MKSEFVYNGVTKKLKAFGMKPEMLCRGFKLKNDDSLLLTDEDGEMYLPDGNSFDPPLQEGKVYTVDGTSKEETPNGQIALQDQKQIHSSDLAVVQGGKRDKIITDVIQSCGDMNEGVNMLCSAPNAVFLVTTLAILSTTAPDPSLITDEMPRDKFKRLTTPGSFRASLYQVAANMCRAFQTADSSMNKIKASLVDLPDTFENTLEIIGEGNDEKIKKIMKRNIADMERASTRCKASSEEAKIAFDEVLLDIDELTQATTTTQSFSEREKAEMAKLKTEFKLQKERQEKLVKQQEEDYERAKKQSEDALQEYKLQVSESGDMGKLIAASLTESILDIIKTPKQLISKAGEAVCLLTAKSGTFIRREENVSEAYRFAVEKSVITSLDTIATELSPDTEKKTIDDWILSLKEYQKTSPLTDVGKELFKKLKEVLSFLEKNRDKLKDSGEKIKEITTGITTATNIAQIAYQERAAKQEREEMASYSLRETIVKADTEKVKVAQDHFNKFSDNEYKLRKELKDNEEELISIVSKLENTNMKEVDLVKIIENLREGITYLGRVKKHWSDLSLFFDRINTVIKVNLSDNIDRFIEEAKDDISRKIMLQSALQATGYCIQVGNCASIYTAISGQYVIPVISNVGELFALTENEANNMKSAMKNNLKETIKNVRDTIEQKQEEFKEQTNNNMISYAEKFANALPGSNKKAIA